MTVDNLFLIASRKKFRFATDRGQLVIEQLWDLPLQSARDDVITLDNVARGLSKQLKDLNGESFVTPKATGPEEELTQKLEIVKTIITIKLEEKAANAARAKRDEKRRRITEIVARKEDSELEGMSKEELLKQLEELS